MSRRIWTPSDRQAQMLDHVIDVGPRTALWAPMGVGKTTTAMSAMDILFLTGEESKPALVAAPLRVAQSTWPDEATKWEHLRHIEVQPIIGNPHERKAALRRARARIADATRPSASRPCRTATPRSSRSTTSASAGWSKSSRTSRGHSAA